MRNTINYFFLILLSFSLIIGCSDESEVAIEGNLITELPENAIRLDNLILEMQQKLGVAKSERNLFHKGLGSSDKLGNDIFYEKVFVVFQKSWTIADKLQFYEAMRDREGGEIFIVPDTCEDIDTWFVSTKATIPGRDREKNLIVASTTTIRGNEDNTEEDDDGPKGSLIVFNSCEEIPLDEYQKN
ncbi:hypothetical protein [uncultured Tenacibaculum sp.]|uniref:hypothetical protein n=1 Tax=uncultured Tenacibaculum sp. TaxID=174713 RepID=UPI002633B3C4|nr:hypothetical protein [uncultured Tenacibaculum sp.]